MGLSSGKGGGGSWYYNLSAPPRKNLLLRPCGELICHGSLSNSVRVNPTVYTFHTGPIRAKTYSI